MKNLQINHPFKLFIQVVFFSTLLLALNSCGSHIRQSTVQLSADVGNRMAEMENLHQVAIQRYFDMECQKVEEFLTNTWEPLFLKNFLGSSQILSKLENASRIDQASRSQLEEVLKEYLLDPSEAEDATNALVDKLNTSRIGEDGLVRTVVSQYIDDDKIDAVVIQLSSLLGTDDPARIIFEFTEAAHFEMNKRRASLLSPIEQARDETVANLGEAYAQLLAGQSTITGRLEAASKVSESQDLLVNSMGLSKITNGIQAKMSNMSSDIDGALQVANNMVGDSESDINMNDLLNTLQNSLLDINNPK